MEGREKYRKQTKNIGAKNLLKIIDESTSINVFVSTKSQVNYLTNLK